MDSITVCGITAFTSGVIAFSCGVLIAVFCNYIIIRKHKAVKKCKENEVSKHPAAVSPFYLQQSDQSLEIPMQEHSQGHNVELQQNEVSKPSSAVSLYPQQSDQSPLYQEIPTQEHSQGHVVELQQNIAYVSQGQIHADLNSWPYVKSSNNMYNCDGNEWLGLENWMLTSEILMRPASIAFHIESLQNVHSLCGLV